MASFACAIALASAWSASAASFLSTEARPANNIAAVAIERLLSSETTAARLSGLQAELRQTYVALPKNENGNIDHSTVRYALHRFFVHKYGWYVKGLTPEGDAWGASTSAVIMKDRVPHHIQSLLDRNMAGRGLDLRGLAMFAATLTDLIQRDVVTVFEEVFTALGLDEPGVNVTDDDVEKAMAGYIARFIFGGDEVARSAATLEAIAREVAKMYSGWQDTLMWFKDQRLDMDWLKTDARNPFVPREHSFETSTRTLQEIMSNFREVANSDCPALKGRLVAIEYEGTGRVRLVDFYALEDDTRRENLEYLRQLGVLDEMDPERPMLLIPNYVSSQTNCLVDAHYYSSCCLNECEGLMAHVEKHLAVPEADPERIVEVVSALASETVDAPRNLSISLVKRLGEISTTHGGLVPLHGRLFSQWMHHAYPRECPYPQLAGTSKSLSQDEWIATTGGNDVFATPEEIAMHKADDKLVWDTKPAHISADNMPWVDIEDLVATHKTQTPPPPVFDPMNVVRMVMCVAGIYSVATPLTKMFLRATAGINTEKATHSV